MTLFGTLRHTNRPLGRMTFWRFLATISSTTILIVPIVAIQAPAGAVNGGVTITNYTDSTIQRPAAVAAGSDGALWFTNFAGNSIGRITTSGVVTNYTNPTINRPAAITAGPDGALWFTNELNDSIGRIATNGTVTSYTDRTVSRPFWITVGPDGALWFTNLGTFSIGASIGRITTNGVVTNYTSPTINRPEEIAPGPDGALWFTDQGTSSTGESIGRITTNGTVSFYTDPTIDSPFAITAGPDGALWFTNADDPDSIGRITTDGTFSFYTDPTIRSPYGITAGPDGALWFSNFSRSTIGRATVPTPILVPSGGGVIEGTSGTTSQLPITVTLSHPSPETVTAQWNTVFINGASNVQAIPGTDYIAANGTVTFPPGATTETVPVTVLDHDLGMPDKLIVVSFHNPINATMGGYYGLAFGFLINNAP